MSNPFAILLHTCPTVDPDLLREIFEERAAVRQYDGGYSQEDAEKLAVFDTIELI